jgi:8-oxo-dGTP diphosphatase
LVYLTNTNVKYTYEYPRPSVTVDCVVFGFNGDQALRVLLIRRKEAPFKGKQALPGGFVGVRDDGDQGESLEAAAMRELAEETGVKLSYLEQLYTFGTPGRDPRGRVISVAYLALVRSSEHVAKAGSDAASAKWVPVQEALASKLAFDHSEILDAAVKRMRGKIRYTPIGVHLLPPEFSLAELRVLYEAILGRALDGANFRKKALATNVLIPTGGAREGSHRPAQLYRFDEEAYQEALEGGFVFEL